MRRWIEKPSARLMDGVMCAMMNRLQWKLRHHACSREEFDAYITTCRDRNAAEFYRSAPDAAPPRYPDRALRDWPFILEWPTPAPSGFVENDTARALVFPASDDPTLPTVVILHALMSASDTGYRALARWFNARGWHVVFPHLPFHYSRTPRGFRQGSLAITANLPRNAETLRQGVTEVRQMLALHRSMGAGRFGLLGTSYGGWTAAIAASLESDLDFVALVQPIVDVEHVIWESPAASAIRRIIRAKGIRPGNSRPHAHLSSPLHAPVPQARHRLIVAGEFDTVSPPDRLAKMAEAWEGTDFIRVRQGHFGYRALAAAKEWVAARIS